jgi:hypothetical protein
MLHHRKFRPLGDWPVAEMNVVHQLKALVPLLAVVG